MLQVISYLTFSEVTHRAIGFYTSSWNCEVSPSLNNVTLRYFFLLLFFLVSRAATLLLADLHHRTKIMFETLTHWFIRINSLLLLKSEQNKKSCICLCWLYFFLLIHVSLSLHVLLIHVLSLHVLLIHVLPIQSMFYQSSPVHVLLHAKKKIVK